MYIARQTIIYYCNNSILILFQNGTLYRQFNIIAALNITKSGLVLLLKIKYSFNLYSQCEDVNEIIS